MRIAPRGFFSLIALTAGHLAQGHLFLLQHAAQMQKASQRDATTTPEGEGALGDAFEKNQTHEASQMFARASATQGNQNCSLLIFVPVGDFEQGGKLLKHNLEHMRSTLEGHCEVAVFLNHYDGGKNIWKEQTNKWVEGWYDKYVQYSEEMHGFKFQVMKKLLRHIDLDSFTWVWALDEDFNILDTDVNRVLQLTMESGALISIPAFTQVGETEADRELSFPMQSPHPGHLYRYADVVEVIFPLFRTAALKQVLWNCEECIGERFVWGLNRIWCSFTARKLGHDRSTACAIIDAAPMVHQNFKTLENKYDPGVSKDGREMENDFEAEAREWMAHVELFHAFDYVAGNSKTMNSTTGVRATNSTNGVRV